MYYVTRKEKLCYARHEKPLKNQEVAKKRRSGQKKKFRSGQKKKQNLWKRIPDLMQQHMTPRKGYNFISLDVIQYTNAKEKEKKLVKRMTN